MTYSVNTAVILGAVFLDFRSMQYTMMILIACSCWNIGETDLDNQTLDWIEWIEMGEFRDEN